MSNTSQTIEITINPKGEAVVHTKGFSGPSCRDASRFIEKALGERVGEKLTAEFYQNQSLRQQATQQG